MPATLQAAIAARIDRLDGVAKRTLNAAAVIGSQFDAELPAILVGETALPRVGPSRAHRPDQVHTAARSTCFGIH